MTKTSLLYARSSVQVFGQQLTIGCKQDQSDPGRRVVAKDFL